MRTRKIKLKLSAVPPAIKERGGRYYLAESAVSFAAVVLRFKEGLSPETIHRECFPSTPLATIYNAAAFYLAHQAQVEVYLEQLRREDDDLQGRLLAEHPEFIKTAEELREEKRAAR